MEIRAERDRKLGGGRRQRQIYSGRGDCVNDQEGATVAGYFFMRSLR